ncbi:hypothetical protein [Frondihabitans cladoniiphilus]|uniref:Lipoprotein n=1 Tax=Frondihabitans cladoniiphilus TaxID=715785 RepID=A0ABP8WAW2_9MICO
MKHRLPLVASAALVLAVGCSAALTGCSTGYPSIAGVWKASDGTANKTISDDGNCTNMLYRGGAVFQSQVPGMCHITGTADHGAYSLRVTQAGKAQNYTASFSNGDKTIAITQGSTKIVTLTQVPSAH